MSRFGAILSVVIVAMGLLVAGAVTGNIKLVDLSIAVAALALLLLVIGVVVWRDEVFATRGARSSAGSAAEREKVADQDAVLQPVSGGIEVSEPAAVGPRGSPVVGSSEVALDRQAQQRQQRPGIAESPASRPGRPPDPAPAEVAAGARPAAGVADKEPGNEQPAAGQPDSQETAAGQPAAKQPAELRIGQEPAAAQPDSQQTAAAPSAASAASPLPAAEGVPAATPAPAAAALAASEPSPAAAAPAAAAPAAPAPAAPAPAAPAAPAPAAPAPAAPAAPAPAAPAAPAPAPAASSAEVPAKPPISVPAEPPAASPATVPAGGQQAAAAGDAAQADEPGGGAVTVVPGIARYHRADCILIRFLGDDDVELMTRAAAAQAGCAPCKACRPDKAAAGD